MPHAAATGAPIRADESLTVPDFMVRTGQGVKSMRRLRKEGLPIIRVGRRSYVLGRDWLDYLARKSGSAK